MPKRRNVVRVMTPEVQGDDSFVVVQKLTVGEAREVLRDGQLRTKAARKQMQAAGDDEQDRRMTQEIIDADAAMENIDWAVRRFAGHIKEWNWVDDDGQPLPQIKDDPTVIDLLSMDEMQSLSKAMGASEEAGKN